MAHYNAQRNNDTRLKDHTGRLFSCDLCSTKSPSNMTCWKDYKQYALDPSSPTDPYLYFALYNEQDAPARILSGFITTSAEPNTHQTKRKNKQARQPTQHQQQVTVQWNDTYILQHHLPAITLIGYTAAQVTPLTGPLLDNPNIPPLLRSLGTETNPLLKVSWEPREEALKGLTRNFGPLIETLKMDFKATQLALEAQRQQDQHPQSGLSQAEQQGIWTDQATHLPSIYPRLQGRVTINTKPINPDMDILPTQSIRLEAAPTYPNLMHCYDTLGAYQGSMSTTHTAALYNQYCNTGHMDPTTFPEQLLALLLHTKRVTTKQSKTPKVQPPPDTPPDL
jgi:hypothetical protein